MAFDRTIAIACLIGGLASPAWGFDPAAFYAATCSACHGTRGAGDGPAAAASPVTPADFSDPAFWANRDDATVATAIRGGGAAIGKSPLMTPFGATLDATQLNALVAYLHGFATPPSAEPPDAPSADPTQRDIMVPGDAVGPTVAAARPEANLARGKALFRHGCATCHGIKGDGKGPAARFMQPKPRDLTRGQFRFRSTGMGDPPLREDLYRTIERGLRGTPMPGFSGMDPNDLWQMVFFVQSLSGLQADAEVRVVPIPASPPLTPASIAHGAEVYKGAGCAACHGEDGRGAGPAAGALTDTAGNRLHPPDLTHSEAFKRGDDPIELYRTISTGLAGTPMAGFEAISPDDRWALLHWILDQ